MNEEKLFEKFIEDQLNADEKEILLQLSKNTTDSDLTASPAIKKSLQEKIRQYEESKNTSQRD